MKRLLISLFIIIVIIGSWLLYKEKQTSEHHESKRDYSKIKHSPLPTEQFITEYLFHQDGTILTNFHDKEEGDIALSESIGLWMEYLVEKEDYILFDEAFHTVQDKFLSNEHLIAWKIEAGEMATTNALIDDLRIIEALFHAGEREDNERYLTAAIDISKAILTYNRQGDEFVDFYDFSYNYANEELTLSYLVPNAFHYMSEYNLLPEKTMEQLNNFMKELPVDHDFYPKYYQVINKTFHYDDIINLIDQLYVAIHLEGFNANTDPFYDWIKGEFYKDKMLYGRYERKTKKRAVDYEAAAVYALTIIYSIEKEDRQFAQDVYEQMVKMQVTDVDSAYYGGYMNRSEMTTHPFDNLLPLLAERKLKNEQIIN